MVEPYRPTLSPVASMDTSGPGYQAAKEVKEEVISWLKELREKYPDKRIYAPFSVLQEIDEQPIREAQADNLGQTIEGWLQDGTRLNQFQSHRILGRRNRYFTWGGPCYDCNLVYYFERGKFPLKTQERTFSIITCYNLHDRMEFENGSAQEHAHEDSEQFQHGMRTFLHFLFQNFSAVVWVWKRTLYGYHSHVDGAISFRHAVSVGIGYDDELFKMWEQIGWKKADIKKIKANMWLIKNPTVLRSKKAEIKKIKADNWVYRRRFPVEIWWPRCLYPEIWELKQEIKKLKKEGRGNEKVTETMEPKAGKYLYPHRLDREPVPLKTKEEYKEDIKRLKREIKELKKKRKERFKKETLPRMKAEYKTWLKNFYYPYRKFEKTPEEKERRRKHKERQWILAEMEKVMDTRVPNLQDTPYPEKEVKDLFNTISKMLYPKKNIRWEYVPGREEIEDLIWSLRCWRTFVRNRYARQYGNCKAYGRGRTIRPLFIDKILYERCRGEAKGLKRLIFRTPHHNRGIGEWKELRRGTRAQIPFPLVIRPICDEHGYIIRGREECRPAHPRDAWRTIETDTWPKIVNYILGPAGHIIFKHQGFDSGATGAEATAHDIKYRREVIRRPFTWIKNEHNPIDRVLNFLINYIW
ncbi:MAG: hypothetical protein ACXQTT_01835 [Candidatus Syntropharchaeia archaeon]